MYDYNQGYLLFYGYYEGSDYKTHIGDKENSVHNVFNRGRVDEL